MPFDLTPLALSADAATAASGGANASWLLAHRLGEGGRRAAVVVLATLNAGIAVQAAASLALFATHAAGGDDGAFFAPGAWLATRVLLLGGTLAVSALIARRRR